MNNDFDAMVEKVIKAIREIYPENKQQYITKECILYILNKMCESEEIFNNNLLLLDRYSQNGMESNYQKKFKL